MSTGAPQPGVDTDRDLCYGRDVRFKDSKSDVLVQLADMCAGAIARSYRKDRAERERWRKMLAPRIDDVWEFG